MTGYFLATAQAIHQFKRLEIYGGGGLGIYFVSSLIEIKPPMGLQEEFDDKDNIFGARLAAGLKINITKTFYSCRHSKISLPAPPQRATFS